MRFKNVKKFGKRMMISKDGIVLNERGQHMKTNMSLGGYKRITISMPAGVGPKIKHLFIHHLVLEAFYGPRPPGWECNHRDGNKLNNRIENLEWCTRAYNLAHHCQTHPEQVRRGRAHARAKFKASTIRHALRLKGTTATRTAAKILGISKSYIHWLWSGRAFLADIQQK